MTAETGGPITELADKRDELSVHGRDRWFGPSCSEWNPAILLLLLFFIVHRVEAILEKLLKNYVFCSKISNSTFVHTSVLKTSVLTRTLFRIMG